MKATTLLRLAALGVGGLVLTGCAVPRGGAGTGSAAAPDEQAREQARAEGEDASGAPRAESETISVVAEASKGDGTLLASATETMRVNGISCPRCATNIEKSLTGMKGITGVEIDLDEGRVTVGLTSPGVISRERIADAIRDAGFTVVDAEG